jgi:hypothetical protein
MFGASIFRSFTFQADMFAQAAGGVVPEPPVVVLPPEVWWPVTPNRHKKQNETDEQRRARVFAEMADDIESIQPNAKPKEFKRRVTQIERAARQAREDAVDRRAEQQFEELLTALSELRQTREANAIAAQQAIALRYARALEEAFLRAEDDAILALILAN